MTLFSDTCFEHSQDLQGQLQPEEELSGHAEVETPNNEEALLNDPVDMSTYVLYIVRAACM